MGASAPAQTNLFATDLSAALQLASTATTSKQQKASNKIFGLWESFCQEHGRTSTLDGLSQDDKIAHLLVFGLRYRQGGQKSKPVRAETVLAALAAVGQGTSHLGQHDPRHIPGSDKLHPLLADFRRAMQREDDPASRSYPVNLTILRQIPQVLDFSDRTYGHMERALFDLIIVAYFWLLRPAEYLRATDQEARSQAFRLCDISFTYKGRLTAATDISLNELKDTNGLEASSLTFTDQKNAVKGECIYHSTTNDPTFCPTKSLARIVHHLRKYKAKPDTPLYMQCNPTDKTWCELSSKQVTTALRLAAESVKHATGIAPRLISTRSLRPGGATALLCANVDRDAIMLLGRWKSDAMLRCLRIQALAHTFSQKMVDSGDCTFHPQAFEQMQLPTQAPVEIQQLLQHTELYTDD